MITINCCVCGKEYQIGNNELNRLWCSVGCQYGEDEMKCSHCNGECCYLDSREGTIRYAQTLTHGKGVHFCKYCEDGTEKSPFSNWYEDWEAVKPNEKLTKALAEMREIQEQAETAYENDADKYWNSLSKEDQLKCFYSVCKRIYEGDIAKRGSYRYVLYDVFGFGPEAYTVGMNCGYMAIHNGLFPDEESNG